MDEVRAESWSHLQELLYEGSWQEELGRFRSDRVFRGHGDAVSDRWLTRHYTPRARA